MQLFKRIGATILVVLVVFSITASCFASAATAQAIDIFGSLYSAYLLFKGVDVVAGYNDGNVAVYDSENPMPEASWRKLWQDNFDYYSSVVDSTIQDVDDWVTTFGVYISNGYLDANGDFHSGSPNNPDPDNKLGFALSAQIVEWFDKFTNAIFKGKYNLSNNGNGFVYNSNSFDSSLVSNEVLSIDGQPGTVAVPGLVLGSGQGVARISPDTTIYPNTFLWTNSSGNFLYALSTVSYYFTMDSSADYGNSYNYHGNIININRPIVIDGNYYYGASNTTFAGLPTCELLNPISGITSSSVLTSSGDDFKLKTRGQATINVPDTDDQDYVPLPLEIPINTPYVTTSSAPDFSDITDPNVQQYIDPVIQDSTTNTLTSPETTPSNPDLNEPSPVMPPFLPFELPSFDFSLSGIWYYVVRWVNSIGSGTSLLFNVFANLPAAMFYPVFGSAVVVIVIGLWKRFLT